MTNDQGETGDAASEAAKHQAEVLRKRAEEKRDVDGLRDETGVPGRVQQVVALLAERDASLDAVRAALGVPEEMPHRAIPQFVQEWLHRNGRDNAPKVISELRHFLDLPATLLDANVVAYVSENVARIRQALEAPASKKLDELPTWITFNLRPPPPPAAAFATALGLDGSTTVEQVAATFHQALAESREAIAQRSATDKVVAQLEKEVKRLRDDQDKRVASWSAMIKEAGLESYASTSDDLITWIRESKVARLELAAAKARTQVPTADDLRRELRNVLRLSTIAPDDQIVAQAEHVQKQFGNLARDFAAIKAERDDLTARLAEAERAEDKQEGGDERVREMELEINRWQAVERSRDVLIVELRREVKGWRRQARALVEVVAGRGAAVASEDGGEVERLVAAQEDVDEAMAALRGRVENVELWMKVQEAEAHFRRPRDARPEGEATAAKMRTQAEAPVAAPQRNASGLFAQALDEVVAQRVRESLGSSVAWSAPRPRPEGEPSGG